jgi:hypothetical protein
LNKQEDKHPNRPHLRPASADNASQSSEPVFHQDDQRPAIPLNDDQIAFYKERIEKGFYCSLEVREKIAAHLTNEVFQRPSK